MKFNKIDLQVTDYSKMSREEWVAMRRSVDGFGGSDIGTICGYDQYKDPITKFYEMIGLKQATYSFNRYTATGTVFEPVVRDQIFQYWDGDQWWDNWQSGVKLRTVEQYDYFMHNPAFPYLYMNIDGRITNDKHFEGVGIYEGKTIGGHYADRVKGNVLPKYICQLQAYMMGTGADYGYIALFTDQWNFMVRPFVPEQDWTDMIHDKCSLFYEAVLMGRDIVKNYKGVQRTELLFEVENRYSEVLHVSSHDTLSEWYSEQHLEAEELFEMDAAPEIDQVAAETLELSTQADKLDKKIKTNKNVIRQWMTHRHCKKAIGEKTTITYKKQLRINARD